MNAGIEADNIDFVCCDDRKIIKTLMPCYDVSQEIGNARAAASAMTAAYAAELLSDSEKITNTDLLFQWVRAEHTLP